MRQRDNSTEVFFVTKPKFLKKTPCYHSASFLSTILNFYDVFGIKTQKGSSPWQLQRCVQGDGENSAGRGENTDSRAHDSDEKSVHL